MIRWTFLGVQLKIVMMFGECVTPGAALSEATVAKMFKVLHGE